MPERYTTKVRAKRIELHYFKRLYPFRRWKLILTIAVPAVAAVWLLVMAARGDHRVYTSGPVSTGHAMFNVQCDQCHVPHGNQIAQTAPASSAFWLQVSDQACLRCHDGSVHSDKQLESTRCVACHVEHKGHVELAEMTDRHCTRCHADLKTKDGKSVYFASIGNFARHPEFAVASKDGAPRVRLDEKGSLADDAKIKLNHKEHMRVKLPGIEKLVARRANGVKNTADGPQLSCTFCHRPDEQQAYMAPISYQTHCAECHPMDFDVPHENPTLVHAFLRTKHLEEAESGKASKVEKSEAAEEDTPRRRGRLGGREGAEEKSGPKGFKEAEAFLFAHPKEQGCQKCHTLAPGEQLPKVVPPSIPARWMPHSRFDHGAHRPLACVECHKAMESTKTTDVLMPSIATCRECHHRDGGARVGCVECHGYHQRATTRDLDGHLTIPKLLAPTQAASGTTPAKQASTPGPRGSGN